MTDDVGHPGDGSAAAEQPAPEPADYESAAAAPAPPVDEEQRMLAGELVHKGLAAWHLGAAVVFLLTAMSWGFVVSLNFLGLYPFEGIELLSYGRVRLLHTNEIAYGFLVNGFIGAMYYAVPRMTGRPVLSKGLGWLIFWVWQSVMVLTSVGQLMGTAQAVATPTGFAPGMFEMNFIPIDFLIQIGAVLVAVQFFSSIVRSSHKRMYVSLWYISAGLVWLILTYAMGSTLPEWTFAGSAGAATVGFFIHDPVGLFVTPMGLGLMYFFVPIILRRPIWSHALSVLGFWALALFYPLGGVHHFLLSAIPESLQYGAVISTLAVEIVVTTVVVNFFGTVWAQGEAIRENLPLRWIYTGMVCYSIACLQCALHMTLTFQEIIHFTDWVPGHAHLVMLGVFAFWLMGIITWLWPRLTGHEWHDRRLNHAHYWLSLIGMGIMFVDLTVAGVVHGLMFKGMAPWMDIIRSLRPFWILRTFAGGLIVLGQLLWAWNLYKTARSGAPYDCRVDLAHAEEG